jgi:Fuc2NAc and GlcNAc transferase
VLSRRFGSHQRVTLSFVGVNLLWLYPLAFYAHNHPNWAPWTVPIAYAPLVALAYLAGAGRRQHDQLG